MNYERFKIVRRDAYQAGKKLPFFSNCHSERRKESRIFWTVEIISDSKDDKIW